MHNHRSTRSIDHAHRLLPLLYFFLFAIVLAACGPTQATSNSPVQVATATSAPTAAPTTVPPTAIPPTTVPVATNTVAVPPTAIPPSATTAPPTATAAKPSPTIAPPPAPTATTAVAPTPVGPTIVVPGVTPTPEARPVPIDVGQDVRSELTTFFNTFYKARTLVRGGQFDFATTRALTAAPYQEYTVSLLQNDAADAAAGKLLAVNYTGISVQLDNFQGSGGTGTGLVTVTRTMNVTRDTGTLAPQTATYQFRLRRMPLDPPHAAWVAFDFFNPGANAWVSDLAAAPTTGSIGSEISAFFTQFYALREVQPGGKLDINRNAQLTAFAYQQYTVPILEQQQKEIASGQLTSIRYTDISTKVLSWDTSATNHGGIATVQVTRTSRVVRPNGAEAPQTATYQFRLHRHTDETGKGYWLAVDFLNPAAGAWVSDSAGQPWVVPPSGHG